MEKNEIEIITIWRSKFLKHYAFYCWNILFCGIYLTAIGPLIPYYSTAEGKHQGFYSLYLFMRAIGYVVGSFSMKILEDYFNYHQGIMLGYLMAGFAIILFDQLDYEFIKCISFFIAFIGTALYDIFSQLAVITCFKGKTVETALLLQLACVGIGNLIAPFLVNFFQLHTYALIGVASFPFALIAKFLSSPETVNNEREQAQEQAGNQTQVLQGEYQQEIEEEVQNLPDNALVYYWLFYFLGLGIEFTYVIWIPTYCVKRGFEMKETASKYVIIFSIVLTVLRILFALQSGRSTLKIAILSFLGFVSAFASVLIIFYWDPTIGLTFSAVAVAIFITPMYGLFQSQPLEYGYQITTKQFSWITIAIGLSQGAVSTLIGILSTSILLQLFFYTIGSIFFMILVINYIVYIKFSDKSSNDLKNTETPQLALQK